VYAFSILIEPTDAFCAITELANTIPIAENIVTIIFDFIIFPLVKFKAQDIYQDLFQIALDNLPQQNIQPIPP
jgi:hypothetical protein